MTGEKKSKGEVETEPHPLFNPFLLCQVLSEAGGSVATKSSRI
jgi:hypothetical protein